MQSKGQAKKPVGYPAKRGVCAEHLFAKAYTYNAGGAGSSDTARANEALSDGQGNVPAGQFLGASTAGLAINMARG